MFKSLVCMFKGHDEHDVITLIGDHGYLETRCKRCNEVTFDMDITKKDAETFLKIYKEIS